MNKIKITDFLKLQIGLQIPILLLVFAISILGIMLLYSASGCSFNIRAEKQFYSMLLGFAIIFIIMHAHPKLIMRYSYLVYFIGIVLALVSIFIGHKAMGAQRWIKLGAFGFQPSEFVKIGIILALARFYHNLHFFDSTKFRAIIIPCIITIIPVLIILKQPNLGTAAVILFIFICISFAAGLNKKIFTISAIIGMISIPLLWFCLHDYQKNRIISFLNPEQDPFGSGYNVIQSKIAIGSGGLMGKGWTMGSQAQLQFLPEKHTDFIASVLAEEFGFAGISIFIIGMALLITFLHISSMQFMSQYGRLVIIGTNAMLFFHTIINLLMISGLFPVVGLPLPFLSYGGSNLIAIFIQIGICCLLIRYDSIATQRNYN